MVGMVSDTLASDQGPTLLSLYDSALPQVYGYLASRCGSATAAEDLTSETFLAAVDAVRRGAVPDLTVAWLIGVARHKLADRSEEHTSELQSLMRSSSAVFCLK